MIECPSFQPWLGSYCSEDRGVTFTIVVLQSIVLLIRKGFEAILFIVPCNGPESSLDCRHSLDTSNVERILKLVQLANINHNNLLCISNSSYGICDGI